MLLYVLIHLTCFILVTIGDNLVCRRTEVKYLPMFFFFGPLMLTLFILVQIHEHIDGKVIFKHKK